MALPKQSFDTWDQMILSVSMALVHPVHKPQLMGIMIEMSRQGAGLLCLLMALMQTV